MAHTRLMLGTNRSDRSRRMDALVREHWGRALLLVPTQAQAARRGESLLLGSDLPGAWGRPVRALTDFAEHLLVAEGKPLRRMATLERGLLLERVLAALHRRGSLPGMPDPNTTPGLARHLLQVIVQLKQAAIEPEAFRKRLTRIPEPAWLDTLVAEVYEAYHEAIVAADAYDVPGLFWQAHLMCLEGKPRVLTDIDLLALDGFDDFTPSELRLVEGLARHVDQVVFGVNHDVRPDRKDLFALTERTVSSLRERFDMAEEVMTEEATPCRRSWLASRIFWRDQQPQPRKLADNLRVVSCVDAAHEVETIARRVKTLLSDGVPPEDVAIIHRNPPDALSLLTRTFAEYGIPLNARQGVPLRQSGVGVFLPRFFEAMRTWSREDLLEVLVSPWANPGGAPDKAVPALAQAAGIVRGADVWRTRLAVLGEALKSGRSREAKRLLACVPDAEARLARLTEHLAWLTELHASLPREGTLADFAQTLDQILDTLQAEETAAQSCRPSTEQAALVLLRRMLGTFSDMADDETISQSIFLRRFEEGLRNTQYTIPRSPRGVTLIDPRSVRGLAFRHVFLAGLNEGVLPAPLTVNAVYSERDLKRLRRAEIVLEDTWAHHARERLLFHHALQAATDSITMSWHALKEGGREAMPSPFLSDVLALFADCSGVDASVPRSEAVLPDPDEAASPREFCNGLTHAGVKADSLSHLFPQAAHALALEAQRQDGARFDEHDGILSDPALVGALADHYGATHQFSANQIECFVACPFKFFLERVLHVEAPEAPEEALDPRTRGSILHAVLQRFHSQFKGLPLTEIPVEEAHAAMDALVPAIFDANHWRTHACSGGRLAMEQRAMRARLGRYLRIGCAGDDEAAWAPSYFETAFGGTPREDADPLSRLEPYGLDTPSGKVLFAGVVDRIDVGDTDGIRLIDYKSGSVPAAGDLTKALDIQLGLYTEVADRHLLPEKTCMSAVYAVPGRTQRREVIPKKDDKWHDQKIALVETVALAVDRIRAGAFPPTPSDDKKICPTCGQRSVCRYEQNRIARKGHARGEGRES